MCSRLYSLHGSKAPVLATGNLEETTMSEMNRRKNEIFVFLGPGGHVCSRGSASPYSVSSKMIHSQIFFKKYLSLKITALRETDKEAFHLRCKFRKTLN